jgi:hypothetical protein
MYLSIIGCRHISSTLKQYIVFTTGQDSAAGSNPNQVVEDFLAFFFAFLTFLVGPGGGELGW